MGQQGTVQMWQENRGFGFIRPTAGGPDVFVHRTGLEGVHFLDVGQAVTYELTAGEGGRTRAVHVRPVAAGG